MEDWFKTNFHALKTYMFLLHQTMYPIFDHIFNIFGRTPRPVSGSPPPQTDGWFRQCIRLTRNWNRVVTRHVEQKRPSRATSFKPFLLTLCIGSWLTCLMAST